MWPHLPADACEAPQAEAVAHHPDLNPVAVVGLPGEVGAACMTRRDVLGTVHAADRIEGAAEAGAVGGAERPGGVEDKCGDAGDPQGLVGSKPQQKAVASVPHQQQAPQAICYQSIRRERAVLVVLLLVVVLLTESPGCDLHR